jgi:hypothetical protein
MMDPVSQTTTLANGGSNIANSRYVGFYGDSRAYLSFAQSSGISRMLRNVAMAHWLQAYGDNAFSLLWELNRGVAGDTTQGMLNRQPAFIELLKSRGSTLVVFIGSTNDRSANIELGISQRNVQEIVRNFLQARIAVIAISETPRGDGCSQYELNTQKQKDDHYAMHLWFEQELSKMCTVFNVWDRLVDTSSGRNYYVKPGHTVDGIHMSKLGSHQVGQVGGPIIAAQVRHLGDYLASNSPYHKEGNTSGTLSPNPMLEGTDGTFSQFTPAEGSVLPSSWKASVQKFDGLTARFTKETDAKGKVWLKIYCSGTSGPEKPSLRVSVPVNMSLLQANDRIKATARVRSNGEGLSNVSLGMTITPEWVMKLDAQDADPGPWPSSNTGVLSRETPMYEHTGDNIAQRALDVSVDINLQANATVFVDIWFSQCGAFKFTY